jgi:prepilin-type N-terminal cleavage/methylation domain-containing protein
MPKEIKKQRGFTIVELLIVIVTIAVLAAIVIVSYSGIQQRAQQGKIQADLTNAQKLLDTYYGQYGTYPVTATNLNPNYFTTTARTDANCPIGTHTTDWIPNLGAGTTLPQSTQISGSGIGGLGYAGCYIYASDGTHYVISAWNMLKTPQTAAPFYRRLGFREMDPSHTSSIFYLCNFGSTIGGLGTGTYVATMDYYKYSYTLSNFGASDCNETPPTGA